MPECHPLICVEGKYASRILNDPRRYSQTVVEVKIKKGLKNLTKLKVKGVSVRVGTDWCGY